MNHATIQQRRNLQPKAKRTYKKKKIMANDKEKIFEQAKEAAQDINNEINTIHEAAILKLIKEKKLMRFDHIFGHFTGCSRATAYNHNLDKLDSIKEALESNRAKGTDYLLQKWISGNNSVLQIAAMRLICTPEERRMLNQQYIENNSSVSIKQELTPEQIQQLIDKI